MKWTKHKLRDYVIYKLVGKYLSMKSGRKLKFRFYIT